MNKNTVIIGVTGGIAAYKICSVVSYLKSKSYDIHVVMTESAKKFVGPITFSALSGNPVIDDNSEWAPNGDIEHILFAKTKLLLIAPATANTIAKLVNGIADNVLTSLALAFTGKILVYPAMNVNMYENKITQANMKKLDSYGKFHVVEPTRGRLACGDVGMGKLPKTKDIIEMTEGYLV